MKSSIPDRVAARAFKRWTVVNDNGCRISDYAVNSKGHPQIGWHDDDRGMCTTTVRRAAWSHIYGQIPDHHIVRLTKQCDPRCCEVEHMRLIQTVFFDEDEVDDPPPCVPVLQARRAALMAVRGTRWYQ